MTTVCLPMLTGVSAFALVGVHQVDAGEEFVGGIDADKVLAGNIEHVRKAGARPEEYRFETFFVEEFVERDAVPDDHVGFEFHAHGFESGDFAVKNFARQAKRRNAIDKDTAEAVKRFEHRDAIVALREDKRSHQRRGAAAHHGDFRASGRGVFNRSLCH